MSQSDIELVKLEEQRTDVPGSTHHNDQVHSSAPSPVSPSSISSAPCVNPSLALPRQAKSATSSPPAASEPHIEQHGTPADSPQAASAPSAAPQDAEDPYLHPTDKLWALYLKDADKEDKHLVESWKGDTDGILIFTGLFAATVATFVTQTYQLLIPPSDDPSAAVLLQASQQLAGLSNGTSVPTYTPPPLQPPFEAPFYAVWVNTLWFLSLFLSLTGALMATLMQQWTRRYLRGIQYRSAPHIRGPLQVMLRQGVKKYRMKQSVTLITAILHASVFIFFAGLVGFAFNLHSTVANVLMPCVSVLIAAYISLSVLPMFSITAPYDTVLTPLFQAFLRPRHILIALTGEQVRKVRALLWQLCQKGTSMQISEKTTHDSSGQRSLSREQELMRIVKKDYYLTSPHTTYALDRILTNADERHEVESFVDSMAVLLSNGRDDYLSLIKGSTLETTLKQHLLGDKIRSLVCSCANFASNIQLHARIKRLRIVLSFIQHTEIREIANLSETIQQDSSYQFTLSLLVGDQNPYVSFLSRLIRICACMEAKTDGNSKRYSFKDTTIAYSYYGEDAGMVPWPLFCLVELACVILKYTAFDGAEDPVATYHHLWQPILLNARDYAIECLIKNLNENEDVIVEPIRTLLFEVGLGNLIHPLYSSPACRHLTAEEQLKIKHAFSTYPFLREVLREIAETVSLVPFYAPLPRPDPGPEGAPTQADDNRTIANLLRLGGWACVLMWAWGKMFEYNLHASKGRQMPDIRKTAPR